MTNKPKNIGTRAETAAVNLAVARGIHAIRPALHGNEDIGDIHLVSGAVVVEVKSRSHRASDAELAAWMAETDAEAGRVDGCDVSALVVKPPHIGATRAHLWDAHMWLDELVWLAHLEQRLVGQPIRVRIDYGDLLDLVARRYGGAR